MAQYILMFVFCNFHSAVILYMPPGSLRADVQTWIKNYATENTNVYFTSFVFRRKKAGWQLDYRTFSWLRRNTPPPPTPLVPFFVCFAVHV